MRFPGKVKTAPCAPSNTLRGRVSENQYAPREARPSGVDFISSPDSARLRPLTPQENATRRTDVSSQNQRPD